MLLATLTAKLQNEYQAIQVQIDALLEQQRIIQAQLQRVGSVESKMESAAQLVAEAIAQIKEVCQEEKGLKKSLRSVAGEIEQIKEVCSDEVVDDLVGYQDTINNFFRSPVATLEAGESDEAEPETSEDSVSVDDDASQSTESETLDVESQVIKEEEESDQQAPSQSLHKQPAKPLQWLAAKKGIDFAGRKRHELAAALVGQVTLVELQEAIEQTAKAG